jgi:hypothetical protein
MIHHIALTHDQVKLIKESLESLDEGYYSEDDIANIQHLIQYFTLKLVGTYKNEASN